MKSIHLIVAVCIPVFLAGSTDAATRRLDIQTVARTGQPAIGPNVQAYYWQFYYLRIGDGGHVAFDGVMQGPDIDPELDNGFWAGTPGHVANVLREGPNAPGVNVSVTSGFMFAAINKHGEMAVNAGLTGGTNDGIIWTGTTTQLTVAAQRRKQAAGAEPGVVYSSYSETASLQNFEGMQFNDLSQLSFESSISGPGIPVPISAIWTGTPGSLQLIARVNSQAPGLPDGVLYASLYGLDNPGGTIAFRGDIKGPSINGTNDVGVWAGLPSDIRLITREGDAAPGVPSATFSELNLGSLEVDDAGSALFTARITGPGINGTNNFGYWLGSPGNTQLLFRSGNPAPGIPNVRLGQFRVETNPGGEYTLIADLTGASVTPANDRALFVGTPGNMQLVAREGDAAPGNPPGVVYGSMAQSSLGIPVAPSGQMAFRIELAGPGVTTANDAAYYLVDADGSLFLVAREGDMFDVGNHEFKQIKELSDSFGGPSDGTMNSQGQLFFRAAFTDGTQGVFIAQIVPEPSSFVLVACAAVCGTTWMRRRLRAPATAR